MQVTFTRKEPPQWLLDMWKEIDDKTFGKGFDCFTEDAVCNLGVADWKGREAIRANLKAFIDTGFTALHHVTEYWDGGFLKVFCGIVDMTPDDVGVDGASDDDPLLLHGREGQYEGAPLDRRGGPTAG